MIVSEQQIIMGLHQGKVIAYPTESVFGLGCDPDNEAAVLSLLALKKRPMSKGLILIAADLAQLEPYIALKQLNCSQLQWLAETWPGPVTWVLPRLQSTPRWLTGEFSTLAVRVSAHPSVKNLCRAYGKPIVSTSANQSGEAPAKTAERADSMFNYQIDVLEGEVGGRTNPSEIREIATGLTIRQG